MELFLVTMRQYSLAVTLVAALLAAASPNARAQEIAPLTSVDLDARLVAAGFDDAQRTLVLRDHASYVQRFTAVVEAQIFDIAPASTLTNASGFRVRTTFQRGTS